MDGDSATVTIHQLPTKGEGSQDAAPTVQGVWLPSSTLSACQHVSLVSTPQCQHVSLSGCKGVVEC